MAPPSEETDPAPLPAGGVPILIRLTPDQALATAAALQAYLAMHPSGLAADAAAALHAVTHPAHAVVVAAASG